MNIVFGRPGLMDGKIAEASPDSAKGFDVLLAVEPRRYSKQQRKVHVLPFRVVSDDGTIIDAGYVSLDAKTCKINVEHNVTPVPIIPPGMKERS